MSYGSGGNGQPAIDRSEHISVDDGESINAKRVGAYVWDTDTLTWVRMTQPGGSSSSSKATEAYSISAISNDGTYKYFLFEDASLNYYIMRKNLSTNSFKYTKGTGGYLTVYVDSTHGPSGSPAFDTYGATF